MTTMIEKFEWARDFMKRFQAENGELSWELGIIRSIPVGPEAAKATSMDHLRQLAAEAMRDSLTCDGEELDTLVAKTVEYIKETRAVLGDHSTSNFSLLLLSEVTRLTLAAEEMEGEARDTVIQLIEKLAQDITYMTPFLAFLDNAPQDSEELSAYIRGQLTDYFSELAKHTDSAQTELTEKLDAVERALVASGIRTH